ncbi:MAG: restriction endonuclease [Deltaproteobacteria bacterium]|nr:restriction endonuclease [Deltaproteobacteria bacterium]
MTEKCKNCNADWKPNEEGACSYCGHRNRIISVAVHDTIHVTGSVDVKLIPKTDFDLNIPYDGKTIIDVSKNVDEKLVSYFRRNPHELKRMNRRLFEELVAELFCGFGYEVELTQQTRDGGIDIIAIRRNEMQVKFLIECKRPDPGGYVSVRAVRELYGVKTSEGATKGIMVTTTYFSSDAKMFLDKHQWELEGKEYKDLSRRLDEYARLKGQT